MDSYMYQTVGHDTIDVIAECMELPLFRQHISGKPITQGEDYETTLDDEVEDLYQLLLSVKVHGKCCLFPGVVDPFLIGSTSRSGGSVSWRHHVQLSKSESRTCVR
jgi:hypothetical protein